MIMDGGFSVKQGQGTLSPGSLPKASLWNLVLKVKKGGRYGIFERLRRPPFLTFNGSKGFSLIGVPRGRAPRPYLTESPHP